MAPNPSFDPKLKLGQVISNADLVQIFRCSSQGGMRRSHRTNSLVLVSDRTRSVYGDQWEGDVLHYTGMGLVGDQDLDFMQNKTLRESNVNGINVYLFEVLEPRKYIYRGLVRLNDKPYREHQIDANGRKRLVWMFPLKLLSS